MGLLTPAAGNGSPGFSGDNGLAVNAQLNGAEGVALDSPGNLYIADSQNFRIRKVTNGVITTVVGSGTAGFSGDLGPATSAQLNGPYDVAVDSAGSLYIAERFNRVRKVTNGVIATVAGNGTAGFSGDGGPATAAELNSPVAVAVHSNGNLCIVDSGCDCVREVSNGVINTVAGIPTSGEGSQLPPGTFVPFSGDGGPATQAQLFRVTAIAVDSAGNLYIADGGNDRIREVSSGVI